MGKLGVSDFHPASVRVVFGCLFIITLSWSGGPTAATAPHGTASSTPPAESATLSHFSSNPISTRGWRCCRSAAARMILPATPPPPQGSTCWTNTRQRMRVTMQRIRPDTRSRTWRRQQPHDSGGLPMASVRSYPFHCNLHALPRTCPAGATPRWSTHHLPFSALRYIVLFEWGRCEEW